MLLRPRTLLLCIVALFITVLTLHEESRSAAHSALTSVGVPLPNRFPLTPDRMKAGLSKWTGGDGGGGYDGFYYDEDDAYRGQWMNTTQPTWESSSGGRIVGGVPAGVLDGSSSSSSEGTSSTEPLVNKMVYHPANGYLLLPDPSKAHAEKPLTQERHPILELIENAERKWASLIERQSKTLEEAVAEYKKRYYRNPPRGFDKWWVWAATLGV